MKKPRQFELEAGLTDPLVTSTRAGNRVTIYVRGIAANCFSLKDGLQRDVVVASLLSLQLRGKQVAVLCHVSEAHVTSVRQRVEAGGTNALIPPPRRPRPSTPLAPSERTKAISLRRRGNAVAAIAKRLGVAKIRVQRELLAAGLSIGRIPSTPSHPARPTEQLLLAAVPADVTHAVKERRASSGSSRPSDRGTLDPNGPRALRPGEPIRSSAHAHRSSFAGTTLLTAMLGTLGVVDALRCAGATRKKSAVYFAETIVTSMAAAYVTRFSSLESMHERDAHGLGVVLGLERSPSVRTLHRALGQMTRAMDAAALASELMRHLHLTRPEPSVVFGVDGHFKAYGGKAPIDKGWNSKKRSAQKGLLDIVVTGASGHTWLREHVASGDGLASHLSTMAARLREVLGEQAPLLLAFDRGGFDFDVLSALDAAGVHYVAWVPKSVNLPNLSAIAPNEDGIGEAPFVHPRLAHACRLIVQRDGDALVPACTNLVEPTDATRVMALLRDTRGMQENSFKSARRRVHIDALNDRAIARTEPDTRLCDNPSYRAMKAELETIDALIEQLDACPSRCTNNGEWSGEYVFADIRQKTLRKQLKDIPARVERRAIDPAATRAFLQTRRRELIVPLKYAVDNAIRDLIHHLGPALSTSDSPHDATTRARTLVALLNAPGTLRFDDDHVHVTLEMPLPPTSHRRLAAALVDLDRAGLRFTDGKRRVSFRLAERTTSDMIPGAKP